MRDVDIIGVGITPSGKHADATVRVLGAAADGALIHPIHTHEYLRTVAQPAIARGLAETGRRRERSTRRRCGARTGARVHARFTEEFARRGPGLGLSALLP